MSEPAGAALIARLCLRQRDGVTCGPSVAIVGAALLDAGYGAALTDPDWFAGEQGRMHRRLNRLWPRALGTTPWAVRRALSAHSPVRYRWRLSRCRGDGLLDVREAVLLGYPVAMLVGGRLPRHWVLLVGNAGTRGFRCYEPGSGEIRTVGTGDVRLGRLTGVGFPRAYAFVLPERSW